jgi:hypothetical protein
MFTIDGFNIINADYGDTEDDFSVYVQCELSEQGSEGGEAFSLTVVSPKRLAQSLKEDATLGRGLIIASDYDETRLRKAIEPLLAKAKTWKDVQTNVERYFDWV